MSGEGPEELWFQWLIQVFRHYPRYFRVLWGSGNFLHFWMDVSSMTKHGGGGGPAFRGILIERSKDNVGNLNKLHHIQTHPLDIMNSEKTKKRKENSATEPEQ